MKKKQLELGALLSYLTIIFNLVAGLLYTPWLIRSIGDDQYALYTLSLSVIHLFMMNFGIGSAVTKFLSNYYAQGQYHEADCFMGIIYKTYAVISGGIALVLLIFYFQIDWIYARFTQSELDIFKRLFIIVAVYSVCSFPFTTFDGILTANEKFVQLKVCTLGQKVLDVALIVVLLIAGQGVYALVLVHAITNFLFIGFKYLLIRRYTRQRANMKSWDPQIARGLFGYSAWYTVMSIARRCIYNIMPTVVAALAGSAEVTIFSLAATIEGYVFTFTDAVNGMFMPRISRIVYGDKEDGQLEKLMTRVAKFHIYTVGLLIIGYICVGRQFVSLWLGDQYELVYYCSLLLILPTLVETPQQIARTSLTVKDVVKEQAILYVAMAVVNLGIAMILLKRIGVVGAAVSVFCAYVLKNIGLNWLYHKHLPIKLSRYFKNAYIRWLVPAIATLLFGLWVNGRIGIDGWLGLVLKAVTITVVYCVLLIVCCVDQDVKNTVRRFVEERKK